MRIVALIILLFNLAACKKPINQKGVKEVKNEEGYEIWYIPFDIDFYTPVTDENFIERSTCNFESKNKVFNFIYYTKHNLVLSYSSNLRLKILNKKTNKSIFLNQEKNVLLEKKTYFLEENIKQKIEDEIRHNCLKDKN